MPAEAIAAPKTRGCRRASGRQILLLLLCLWGPEKGIFNVELRRGCCITYLRREQVSEHQTRGFTAQVEGLKHPPTPPGWGKPWRLNPSPISYPAPLPHCNDGNSRWHQLLWWCYLFLFLLSNLSTLGPTKVVPMQSSMCHRSKRNRTSPKQRLSRPAALSRDRFVAKRNCYLSISAKTLHTLIHKPVNSRRTGKTDPACYLSTLLEE